MAQTIAVRLDLEITNIQQIQNIKSLIDKNISQNKVDILAVKQQQQAQQEEDKRRMMRTRNLNLA